MSMSYEEFVILVKESTSLYSKSSFDNMEERYYYRRPKDVSEDIVDYYFYNEEYTGGVTDGSCWDTGTEDHHHSYTNETGAMDAIKGFDKVFDEIMMKVCPNITFLQYKKLHDEVVKTSTRHENEYYGNYTEYLRVYCIVRELFEALVQQGLL